MAVLLVKGHVPTGSELFEVGQLTETVFPMHDVRFIAVNDRVDSDLGEDDFTPFRNIMKNIHHRGKALCHFSFSTADLIPTAYRFLSCKG